MTVKLSEVAKEAGVSITTASRVLNNGKYAERISPACTARVREVAARLGYICNYHHRSIRTGRAETIALVLDLAGPGIHRPPGALLGTAYWSSLIAGIEAVTHDEGYNLTLVSPSRQEWAMARALEGLRSKRFDGLVIPAVNATAERLRLLDSVPGQPVVAIQPRFPCPVAQVVFDTAGGMALVAKYLAELGHRRLLYVAPQADTAGAPPSDPQRQQALVDAAGQHGLTCQNCYFAYPPPEDPQRSLRLIEHAARAVAPLLAPDRSFTAVACYNDLTAIGVLRAAHVAGVRVPEDLSVIGFDNLEAAMTVPALTTIDQHIFEIGEAAGTLVFDLLNADEEGRRALAHRRQLIAADLVVRGSTAAVGD